MLRQPGLGLIPLPQSENGRAAVSSRQPSAEEVKPGRLGFLHWAKDNGEEEDVRVTIAMAGSQDIPLPQIQER